MAQQLTTSVANALLAWSSVYFIYHTFWYNFLACIGLAVQGSTAALGVVRYAMSRSSGQIYDYHQIGSWLSQVMGLPLLAVGFSHKEMPVMMNLNLLAMIAVLVGSRYLAPGMRHLATSACAGFALLTVLVASLRDWNLWGIMGVSVYIAGGRLIGSEGFMVKGALYAVDVQHVVFGVGNVLFAWALQGE